MVEGGLDFGVEPDEVGAGVEDTDSEAGVADAEVDEEAVSHAESGFEGVSNSAGRT